MKKGLYPKALFVFTLLSLSLSASAQKPLRNHPATGEHLINVKKEGTDFIENKGQWIEEAKFRADIPDGVMFITNKGFVYNYANQEDWARVNGHNEEAEKHTDKKSDLVHFHAYKVNFDGANPNPKYVSTDKRVTYQNYFLGNDKSKWAGHVGLYGKVTQQNIYNGVDVQVYSKKNALKYDFIVSPGADVNQIKLSFDGVTPQLKPDGSIYIKTSVNEVTELAPYTYQIINGQERVVKSNYKLEKGHLSFEFPEGYDKTQTLVIDPILVFATFSGGTGAGNSDNYGFSTTYDAFGNLYAGAECYPSSGWPTTTGAFQQNIGGNRDVGINKYNAAGSTLIYSTFYGGSSFEVPNAMKVNDLNELVVVGSTNSSNLPMTTTSYDNSLSGVSDMFVAHFSADGSTLIGASYLGGSANEPFQVLFPGGNPVDVLTTGNAYNNQSSQLSPMELTFDPAGNIWVVGNTNSTDIDIVGASSRNTYTIKKWVCHNSTYIFGTQVLTTSGTYTQTFATLSGCDSVVKLILTVGEPIVDTVFKNICPGTTYQFGPQSLSASGVYTHTFTSLAGCDSTVVLHLGIKPYITQAVSKAICPGTGYQFGPAFLTAPGVYVDTFPTLGCDSIATLTLSIKPYKINNISQDICAGKSYTFGTIVLHNAGTYIDTFSSTGCDSIVTLNLTVSPYVRDTVQATFCTGTTYKFDNQSITTPGTYIDTMASLSGCDRIIVLQLSNGTVNKYKYYPTICQGGSYAFGSQTLTTPGDYTHTFTTSGCDSMVTIHLEYRPNITNSVTAYICPGGSYQFGSQTLTTSGTYTHAFPTSGCDSVVTLTLNESVPYNDTIDVSICQGTGYPFGPTTLITAGTYTHTFASSLGCDSTVTVHLDFLPYITTFITDSICNGATYVFGTQMLTTSGTYLNVYPTAGCDSVITLSLYIKPVDTFTFTENYCAGSNYYFGDTVITTPGTYFRTFDAASGCDSIVRLILTGPWTNSNILSGGIDIIIYNLSPTCDTMKYSSYLGGAGNDSPTGLVFNNAGNLIISGVTSSSDFRTTTTTLHPTYQGGTNDGFVSIINPQFGSMIRSTYLGTNNIDHAAAVQVDDADDVYVLGRTLGNYPISTGVYTGNANGDIFIERLDPFLETSIMSTRMGNNQTGGRYFPSAFLVDICRNVYVAGTGAQAGMPLTPDASQPAQASFWFGVLTPDFGGLFYGSYFGVLGDHNHVGINRMDPNGIVYQSVCCSNFTYPGTTVNSWSQTKQTTGGQDIVSFKFNFEATGVQSNFELAPNQNDTGCAPYTVTFVNTSTAAITYLWDFDDNTTSTLANPTHTFTDTGTYNVTLIATNPNTCITEDTSYFTIIVQRASIPDLTVKDTVLCAFEQNIDLHVQINNPSNNNIIQWGPATGIVGLSDQVDVTVDPTLNDQYYVIVKDSVVGICGFTSSDTINIDLAPRVLTLLTPDTVVCQGTVIPILATGTPAYNYTWDPATGLSDSTILQPTLTANQSQIYTLTGKYYACPDTSVTLKIEVQQYPNLVLPEDKYVCQGTDVTLGSGVTPYRDDYIYQWSPATSNLSNPTGPNTHFIADSTIEYILNVKTPIGCSDQDTVLVTVYPIGFGSIIADTGYCSGIEGSVNLWAGGGSVYEWSPSYGLSDVNIANPVANPPQTTEYTVLITDAHNCMDTEKVTVRVYPAAILSLPDSINIYSGEQFHLQPESNASYFTWFPPSGLSNTNIADPLVSPEVRTRYFVTAITEAGCKINDSIDVIVKETVLDMPNAFAPNGANNMFKPSKRGIATLRDFSIYNRWGNKVYSTSNIDAGWDGTYNGKPQPVGVYIYTIEAVTDSGKIFTQKGNVTLIR
ncbi:T9SS type B sorting domain-containing protein [Taibaiella lutea]|uniref:T9SS type B sorting domain-containing protein n=1 Tax=Taibaiella lutea TaxID=2608001 RepID=A0A5M6CNB2_9BACT|nr:gliding motility-associated C-terminal domain-containing protein [Taibaiella lutea]KAA5536496.1 T9SS type B sorting domain-containing protein [Taibaiella lutea]